jgi:hypothetical protein
MGGMQSMQQAAACLAACEAVSWPRCVAVLVPIRHLRHRACTPCTIWLRTATSQRTKQRCLLPACWNYLPGVQPAAFSISVRASAVKLDAPIHSLYPVSLLHDACQYLKLSKWEDLPPSKDFSNVRGLLDPLSKNTEQKKQTTGATVQITICNRKWLWTALQDSTWACPSCSAQGRRSRSPT